MHCSLAKTNTGGYGFIARSDAGDYFNIEYDATFSRDSETLILYDLGRNMEYLLAGEYSIEDCRSIYHISGTLWFTMDQFKRAYDSLVYKRQESNWVVTGSY